MNTMPTQQQDSALTQLTNSCPEQVQYLTFMLDGEMFAFGILHVKEIIGYGGLSEVPMMPNCIRGVINLRGAAVPVMDLQARFGKPPSSVSKRTCIIIVETVGDDGRRDIGVVVDAVNAVQEIPPSGIAPAPTFGMKIHTSFIEGMGKVNDKFVILLDPNQALSVKDIGPLSQVGGAVLA